MYNEDGQAIWETALDSYGKVKLEKGETGSCPFRYQGQYEDVETGLYYNRFRYYSPEEGMYISQDPIGLAGNNPTLYGYVKDINTWIDPWGLTQGEYPALHSLFHGRKPNYVNPGHHQPGHPNFRGGGSQMTSIIPKNAKEMYKSAIPDKTGKHWYSLDEGGATHIFRNGNDGTAHWAGSSDQGIGLVVPPEVQKRLNHPKQKKAPKAVY